MKLVTSVAFAVFLIGCGHSPTSCDAQCTSSNPDAGGSSTAALTWDAPATYTDGTPLTVAGYHIYYGTTTGAYGSPIDVKAATSYVFSAPSPATYYFAVTAYDSSGSESAPSTEASKTLE